MSKIELDKYYTSIELAEYCVRKTKEIIGTNNITEYLEPSAGNGVFLDVLDKENVEYLAYDIEPEDIQNRIIQQNYLELDISYKKGRCIIGNPPYGRSMNLAQQFFKKSILISDYIAFILPISQLNNNQQMYEFDLIHSEIINNTGFIDLDKRVKLCFNIYKRPINNILNKKPKYKLKDVEIIEVRLKNKIVEDYDLRICAWGWKLGQEVEYENQFAKEFCIKMHNEKYKEQILELFKKTRWQDIYPMTANENLLQWQVYKYIKEQIPEIE